jgi:hypothetical protein
VLTTGVLVDVEHPSGQLGEGSVELAAFAFRCTTNTPANTNNVIKVMTTAAMMLRDRGEFQRIFAHRICRLGVSIVVSTASLISFFDERSHGVADAAAQDDASEASVTVLVFIVASSVLWQTVRASPSSCVTA